MIYHQLSPADLASVEYAARRCVDRHAKAGSKHIQGLARDEVRDLDNNEMFFGTEVALARHLKVAYEFVTCRQTHEYPDVAGYEVRGTKWRSGRLIVTPHDYLNRPFALARWPERRSPVELCGWATGYRVKQEGSWEVHREGGGCWYLEAKYLESIVSAYPLGPREMFYEPPRRRET